MRDTVRAFFLKIIRTLTFTNLPIRKKFILFSAGTLFWIIVTSAIGLTILFYLNSESGKLVDVVEPYTKALNSSVRKLSCANVSMHKMFVQDNREVTEKNYNKARTLLEECSSHLKTLRKGGFVKEYSDAENQIVDEFFVHPLKEPGKKPRVEDVLAKIIGLETLASEIVRLRENTAGPAPVLTEKLSEYDAETRKAVYILGTLVTDLSSEGKISGDAIKRGYNTALILITLTLVTGASLSIVFGILISLNLVGPINAIAANFRAFRTKADFAKELAIPSKDELGILAIEYNNFIRELNAMTSFKKIIEEDESVDDVYNRLGSVITEELGLLKCTLYEISTYKNKIKIVYPHDAEASKLFCSMDILINCDLCRAKRTGHTVSSRDHHDICKYFKKETSEVHICIPIFISGKVGGVMQMVIDGVMSELPEIREKIKKSQQYIQEAQPVLEAKRIMRAFKESSIRDGLTDIYNRRFLEETSETLVSGILRRKTSLGLLMCDLDFFKEVNDKYGHDTGDKVLKATAEVIKKSVRTSDLVIRFGGEEFLVLLIDIHPETSIEIAEKIRMTMEQTKVSITGGAISKTISIGVCEFPQDTQSFWEAIKFADVALYKAKETGRNKVVRFASDMWTEDRY